MSHNLRILLPDQINLEFYCNTKENNEQCFRLQKLIAKNKATQELNLFNVTLIKNRNSTIV